MKKNKFKSRLRQTREKCNFTQTELANLLNINVTTYRNYENTEREPDYDTLIKVCDILDITTDFLLGRTSIKVSANPPTLPKDHQELLSTYEALPLADKKKAIGMIRLLAGSDTEDSIPLEKSGA